MNNRLSQTIVPLALSIGLAVGLELSAIASPRYSHQQYNRSGVVIINPSRHGNNYQADYRSNGRNIDYGRRYRYDDRYDYGYYNRGYRRRSSRYNSYDCGRRNRRLGSSSRYYSGQRVIVNPPIYQDSLRNRDYNGNHIRVIRY